MIPEKALDLMTRELAPIKPKIGMTPQLRFSINSPHNIPIDQTQIQQVKAFFEEYKDGTKIWLEVSDDTTTHITGMFDLEGVKGVKSLGWEFDGDTILVTMFN